MHRIIRLSLLLFLAAAASAPPGAAAPRLFFSKNIKAPQQYQLHTVQPEETVFRIMRARGWTNDQIDHALPRIKQANPHIPDLNALRPGQRIFLPPPHTDQAEAAPEPPAAGLTQKTYTVQPGDTLLGILRQRTGHDLETLRQQYLPLFEKLNPEIANIDRLYPGQNITLPVPGTPARSARAKNATTPAAKADQHTNGSAPAGPQPAFSGPLPRPQEDAPAANASVSEATAPHQGPEDEAASAANASRRQAEQETFFALAQRAGYRPIRGGERYFPTDKGWLTVDPERTPLVQTPGGETLVLVPDEATEKFADAGLTPLAVPGNWDTRDALNALSQNSPDSAQLWTRNRPLITHRKGLGLELRGKWIFVDKTRTPPRIYVLLAPQTRVTFTARVLAGLLQERSILLCTWDAEARELSPIQPPPADDLFVPRMRMQELRQEYGPTIPLSSPRTRRHVVVPQSEAPIGITFQCRTLRRETNTPALVFAHGTGAYLPALLHATGRDCWVLAP